MINIEQHQKQASSELTIHQSGDVTWMGFTFPKGLAHKQYVGLVLMVKAAMMGADLKAGEDTPGFPFTYNQLADLEERANKLMSEGSVVGM